MQQAPRSSAHARPLRDGAIDPACSRLSKNEDWSRPVTNPTGVKAYNTAPPNNANINLAPGVYIFNNVDFKLTSGSISGTGVTIILTGTSGDFNFNSNVIVNLKAPTSGTTAGIALWAATPKPIQIKQCGGLTTITGAVYLPNHNVKYSGNSVSGPGCTQLIARNIEITGTGTFKHDCKELLGDAILDPWNWSLAE